MNALHKVMYPEILNIVARYLLNIFSERHMRARG